MEQVIASSGVRREADHLYFLLGTELWRTRQVEADARQKMELVWRGDFARYEGYLYEVDANGQIVARPPLSDGGPLSFVVNRWLRGKRLDPADCSPLAATERLARLLQPDRDLGPVLRQAAIHPDSYYERNRAALVDRGMAGPDQHLLSRALIVELQSGGRVQEVDEGSDWQTIRAALDASHFPAPARPTFDWLDEKRCDGLGGRAILALAAASVVPRGVLLASLDAPLVPRLVIAGKGVSLAAQALPPQPLALLFLERSTVEQLAHAASCAGFALSLFS